MKRLRIAFTWSLLGVLLGLHSSCKDPEPKPPPPEEEANEWIYKQMSAQYLYNTSTKSITPEYEQESEDFFESLLSASPNDNDGKHYDSNNSYFYSYLERIDDSSTAPTSYGIEYAYYAGSPSYARILYVAKGSAADIAGLERGQWIEKINGTAVTKSNINLIKSGWGVTLTVGEASGMGGSGLVWKAGSPTQVMLSGAGSVVESPVRLVLGPSDLSATQTGYLLYNQFDPGPKGFDDKTYDNELKNAFRQFKSAGVRNLIIDLRYNAGGYIECCSLLASMIAPQGALGKLFAVSRYNEDLMASKGEAKTYLMPLSEISDCNLNLSRVCILTGKGTASSSELLINGLKPYMTVHQIGARTEGKNVGGHTITSNGFKIRLHPITVQLYNSLDESDYKNGFVPDLALDELEYDNMSPLFPLGDTDEWLLADAIAWLQGRTLPYPLSSRASSSGSMPDITTSIQRMPGGVILAPLAE